MKQIQLDRTDIENIEDCLSSIEKMYQFKFEEGEIESIQSFDGFCELIIRKINAEDTNEGCSSQQAFQKLRKSLIETGISEREMIHPEIELKELFPRKNRIRMVKNVEQNIGFRLDILSPPLFVSISNLVLFLVSIVYLFIDWKYGAAGIVVSYVYYKLSRRFAKELNVKTFSQLVKKVVAEHYLSIRSQKNTINKPELKEILMDWFVENAAIDKKKLVNGWFTLPNQS